MAPKQKPNGFLLFMQDFKRREERIGRTFPRGLKDVQADPSCNMEWQTMSPNKKAEYNQRAKNSKNTSGKKTGAGECMQTVEKEKRSQEEFQENMKEEIESLVALAMEFDNLPDIKFNFIHCNWLYRKLVNSESNKLRYVPVEFAVSEFSLREGYIDHYHELLKTAVELGYQSDAMATSQSTHKIPPLFEYGEENYTVMAEKFVKFLSRNMKGNKYPVLYTSKQIKPAVLGLIEQFTKVLKVPEDTFVVYELEWLFTHLRNASLQHIGQGNSFQHAMAEYELIKDSFSYTPGLDCNYHKALDGSSPYCSLSTVKRWAFTICDYCCENFRIRMVRGAHQPLLFNPDEDPVDNLAAAVAAVQIQEMISMKSMTGVSEEYRIKVSERTNEEEQKRRRDKNPVTVIKCGDLADPPSVENVEPATSIATAASSAPCIPEFQRPLRRPNSISHAIVLGKTSSDEHSYNESEFPSLGDVVGRGNGLKKKNNGHRPGTGRGRGIALS